jgi:hypothetical protein
VGMVPFLLWTMVGQFCARKTGVIFPTRDLVYEMLLQGKRGWCSIFFAVA